MQIWEAKVAFAIWKMETHIHWLQKKNSGKTMGTNNMYIWEAKVAVMAAPPHPSSNAFFHTHTNWETHHFQLTHLQSKRRSAAVVGSHAEVSQPAPANTSQLGDLHGDPQDTMGFNNKRV